jgi:hypothetical protein
MLLRVIPAKANDDKQVSTLRADGAPVCDL